MAGFTPKTSQGEFVLNWARAFLLLDVGWIVRENLPFDEDRDLVLLYPYNRHGSAFGAGLRIPSQESEAVKLCRDTEFAWDRSERALWEHIRGNLDMLRGMTW